MHVDCAALREFARWGAKKRYWTPAAVDEMPEVVRPEALPRPMTSTQRDRVMTLDLEPAEAALRALLYYTGAREFELLALRLSDLAAPHRLPDNTEAPGFVRLWGKGRRERIVEMHPDLWRALEAHLAQARGQHTDHFVLSLTAQPWSKSMVINRVKRWGADADVPTLTPHVFRHCFATDTLEATNDLLAVQQLLGHRRPETTQIYTKVVDRRRNAAVRSLPSFSTPALPGGDP
jgi:integrase/recombinase XerD